MIFLGTYKAGATVKYRANFHNDQGTLENPTSPEAQREDPASTFTALTAPAIINAKTGHYGGSIDTTGFATGQHFIRMAGTVATAKVVATEFCFQIVAYDPNDATDLGLTNLDAAISSRLATAGYTAPDNAGITAIKAKTDQLIFTIANKLDASIQAAADFAQAAADKVWGTTVRAITDKAGFALSSAGIQAIWDALTSALTTAGSIGKKLADWVLGSDAKVVLSNNAHTGAVIPTVTAVTNDVGITQAGADKVWGTAARTLTSFGTLVADIWAYSSRTLTAFSTALALAVWDVLETAIATASSIGLKVKTNLDAAITTRSSHTAADVWASATRTLTSFGTLVTDIWANATRTLTSFGTLAADVWAVATRALTDKVGFALSTAGVQAIWDALVSALTTVGSIGKLLADYLNYVDKAASIVYEGSVTGAATTTTLIDSGLTQTATDFWKGRIVIFTSGTLKYQATDITAFDPALDKLTFTALTGTPALADTYVIV